MSWEAWVALGVAVYLVLIVTGGVLVGTFLNKLNKQDKELHARMRQQARQATRRRRGF